jgi:class 3 adenylate cyclase
LSRQAERLVAAAPALLTATTPEDHEKHATRIRAESEQLNAILDDLRTSGIDASVIKPIELAVNWLTLDLISLETTVGNAHAIGEQRKALGEEALRAIAAIQRALRPGMDRRDAGIADSEKIVGRSVLDPTEQHGDLAESSTLIPASWPVMHLRFEVTTLGDRLGSAASVDDRGSLDALGRQLVRSLDRIEALAVSLDESLRLIVIDRTAQLRAYVDGPNSVLRARGLELNTRSDARQVLEETTKASLQLTEAVDRLVSGTEEDIRQAGFQARHEQQVSMLVLAAVVVLSLATSALIVWLYVDRNLVRRLTALSDSMLSISRGNLKTAVPTGGSDEIAGMADALTVFRATTVERAAAERARANLSRYFSPNLADHLAENPDTLELGGERRDLTFLFTDLAEFTPLVEQLDPTVVVSVMNDYIGGIASIVFEHGGTVDTVVGDAVHAMFGAPIKQPDHAARAVACALAINRFAEAFSARMSNEGVPVGVTRIGVHTGSAIVGNFGGESFFHYTAHGDAINTAARLETANKALGTRMCVGADTVALIPDFIGRPIGDLILKGKVQEIGAFEPVGANEAGSEQLAEYLAAFEKLKAGDPGCLQAFASHVGRYGNEPLASFHLQRLLAGQISTKILVAGE